MPRMLYSKEPEVERVLQLFLSCVLSESSVPSSSSSATQRLGPIALVSLAQASSPEPDPTMEPHAAGSESHNDDAVPAAAPQPSPAQVEVLCDQCILIRNTLSLCEQVALFEYIQQNDKTPADTKPRAMVPAPKTLMLGEDEPSLRYTNPTGEGKQEQNVVTEMVAKASQILKDHGNGKLHVFDFESDPKSVFDFKALSMATIKYEAPTGAFPPHVDHCGESLVFLASLGCTANFMVKSPAMEEKMRFKFHSGDLLVFNASTKAALLHAVVSIDEGCSPTGNMLAEKFPVLQTHRFGVQCRMSF